MCAGIVFFKIFDNATETIIANAPQFHNKNNHLQPKSV